MITLTWLILICFSSHSLYHFFPGSLS
jgi:hypothetical protein